MIRLGVYPFGTYVHKRAWQVRKPHFYMYVAFLLGKQTDLATNTAGVAQPLYSHMDITSSYHQHYMFTSCTPMYMYMYM